MTTNKPKIKSAISLKLDRQSDERQERLNKWLDAQSNYTNSVFSLIEHMIDRFGYEDITSHEITKRLFLERLHYEGNATTGASISSTNTPEEIPKEIPVKTSLVEPLPVNTKEENATNSNNVTSEDDVKNGETTQKPPMKKQVDVDVESFFRG